MAATRHCDNPRFRRRVLTDLTAKQLLHYRLWGFVGRSSCREMDCFAGPRDDEERLM
jgi:hypothetical protein